MEQSHANVDPAEVRRFEELATRWWDPLSEFRPLHDINPLRLDYIDRRAGLAGKRVLDVGCGGGILSESMVDAGATVTGIDMGEACLAVAKLHQLESGIAVDYRHATAEAVAAEEAGQYDIVTCMEMLEHVPEPAQVIAACAELVRPGGDVFFSTINRNPKSYLLAIIGAEYLLRLLPRGTHDYARFIKPSEMDNWCRATGLDIADLIGMTYNPITRSYALGRDIDVNYIAHYRRPD